MIASVMIPLLLLVLYNGENWKRAIPCFIVFLITWAQFVIYPTDLYLDLQDLLGFYGYTALVPLSCIALMALFTNRWVMDSKLSTCLMSLFTLWIGVIITFGWLEGVGVVVEPLVEPGKFVVYVIELALMFSTRFTDQMAGGLNALYGNIQRYATGRGSPTSNSSSNGGVHSPDHHMGSNQ